MALNRDKAIIKLKTESKWDMIIIGGGATGLGIAVDAASRGFKTLLLEQSDFAKGTSSRSTKLVHGGVRYLAQGDVALVYEALHERELLFKNAAHLVKEQSFIIPVFDWFSKMKYLIGLKFYDLLAGKGNFSRSEYLSKEAVLEAIPGLNPKGLKGGVRYSDGQFDDARLAVNLAQTAADLDASVLNYIKVTGLIKENQKVAGVEATDLETGDSFTLKAKTVINATGVFVDDILSMDNPNKAPMVRPSQGAHIVLDASFLKGTTALMIPKTADGRVLFAVPWHGKVLIGTTDTPLNQHQLEPRALEDEIQFILTTAGQYLTRAPKRTDVLSVFAGLRPLAAPTKDTNSTKEISRSHKLVVSSSNLITITGGKWTTYRKMALDTVDKAISLNLLPARTCQTHNIAIHGHQVQAQKNHLSLFGTDEQNIRKLMKADPLLSSPIHQNYPYVKAEIKWMVDAEMARNIEDVLARRWRLLFLDAKAAVVLAPGVAQMMALCLNKDEQWIKEQITSFSKLAGEYLLIDENKGIKKQVQDKDLINA
ncbi:MAG: glycerol-3-phosphate dehydrogenase/oxidase [Pedobacter sp.]|nr:MAG: glycerol-3-phosphate dehydrogenase/oxidase [Pedobacter sp.]